MTRDQFKTFLLSLQEVVNNAVNSLQHTNIPHSILANYISKETNVIIPDASSQIWIVKEYFNSHQTTLNYFFLSKEQADAFIISHSSKLNNPEVVLKATPLTLK